MWKQWMLMSFIMLASASEKDATCSTEQMSGASEEVQSNTQSIMQTVVGASRAVEADDDADTGTRPSGDITVKVGLKVTVGGDKGSVVTDDGEEEAEEKELEEEGEEEEDGEIEHPIDGEIMAADVEGVEDTVTVVRNLIKECKALIKAKAVGFADGRFKDAFIELKKAKGFSTVAELRELFSQTSVREVFNGCTELVGEEYSVEEAIEKEIQITESVLVDLSPFGEIPDTDLDAVDGLPSMMQTEEAQAGRSWAGGVVPYCFAPDITQQVRDSFLGAIQHISQRVPCLRFRQANYVSGRSNDNDRNKVCNGNLGGDNSYIFLQSQTTSGRDGCWASLGVRRNGATPVNLNPNAGCDTFGIAVHEVLHALGHAHEQSRPDRDRFVRINWQNIQSGAASQFRIISNADTRVGYDYNSIMHYERTLFSVGGGRETITPTRNPDASLGNRFAMTNADIDQTQRAYGCQGAATPAPTPINSNAFKPCPSNNFCGSDSRCTCGAGLVKHKAQERCYQCRTAASLHCFVGDSGRCTTNPSTCTCPSNLFRATLDLGGGRQCWACRTSCPRGASCTRGGTNTGASPATPTQRPTQRPTQPPASGAVKTRNGCECLPPAPGANRFGYNFSVQTCVNYNQQLGQFCAVNTTAPPAKCAGIRADICLNKPYDPREGTRNRLR